MDPADGISWDRLLRRTACTVDFSWQHLSVGFAPS